MTVRVEIFARGHGKTTESELLKIVDWDRELFAEDQKIIDAFTWENKRGLGFNIQTYRNSELVGFAHVFTRVAQWDDSIVLMGGLGGVMTASEHQGTGIGKATVEKAGEVILRNFRADLGVLLCKSSLIPFYELLGWRRMQGPVVIEQSTGEMQWPQEVMVLLKQSDDPMPKKLNLCGLPF